MCTYNPGDRYIVLFKGPVGFLILRVHCSHLPPTGCTLFPKYSPLVLMSYLQCERRGARNRCQAVLQLSEYDDYLRLSSHHNETHTAYPRHVVVCQCKKAAGEDAPFRQRAGMIQCFVKEEFPAVDVHTRHDEDTKTPARPVAVPDDW